MARGNEEILREVFALVQRPRIQAATDAFGDLLDSDGEAVSPRDLRNEIGGPTPPGHADLTRWPPPHRRDTAQAMSQENVELVRSAFAAWNRGDLDAWLAHWDEHAQIYPLRAQLEGRAYDGHEGLRRFLADMAEDWEGLRFEMDEIREADEQIVGSGRFQARGRVSGIELDVPLGVIGVVRKGKLVYARFFSDPADAIAAAGLAEKPPPS